MIVEPLNDRECLGRITDRAREWSTSIAPAWIQRHGITSPGQLVRAIQELPQRNDDGEARRNTVACEYPVRLRAAPPDPNCVERAALYLAAAEVISPQVERTAITVDLAAGRHTLPVERREGAWEHVDLAPRRNADPAAAEALQTTKDIVHPIGSFVLGIFGAGAVAQQIGELEDRGISEVRGGPAVSQSQPPQRQSAEKPQPKAQEKSRSWRKRSRSRRSARPGAPPSSRG